MTHPREPFMAFAADAHTRSVIVEAAKERRLPVERVFEGDISDVRVALADIPTPEILIVDFADTRDPIAAANTLAEVCDPGTRVITIGEVNDVGVFRTLTGLGIHDYLVKPVTAAHITDALSRLQEPIVVSGHEEPVQTATPTSVIIGARGGVGASTVALNCAWIAAEEHMKKVVLMDMDLHFGSTALSLDLEPERGFREAIDSPDRIDELLLQRAMIKATDRLHLLSTEEDLSRPVINGVSSFETLLGTLKAEFDAVYVDLPRMLTPIYADLLASASTIAVVVDLSLPSLRDALRILALAKVKAPDAELVVIADKNNRKAPGVMDKRAFEKALERKIDLFIPADTAALAKSAGKARVVADFAPRTDAAKAYRKVAERLSGAPKTVKSSFWKRLTKGGTA